MTSRGPSIRSPRGFHLKEYTNRELAALMREAGFTRVRSFLTVRGRTLTAPIAGGARRSKPRSRPSGALGRRLARTRLGTGLLGNRIAAIKALADASAIGLGEQVAQALAPRA